MLSDLGPAIAADKTIWIDCEAAPTVSVDAGGPRGNIGMTFKIDNTLQKLYDYNFQSTSLVDVGSLSTMPVSIGKDTISFSVAGYNDNLLFTISRDSGSFSIQGDKLFNQWQGLCHPIAAKNVGAQF